MKVHCQETKITNIAKSKIAKKAYIGDVEVLIEAALNLAVTVAVLRPLTIPLTTSIMDSNYCIYLFYDRSWHCKKRSKITSLSLLVILSSYKI